MDNTEINTWLYWWWPGQWLRIVYAVWLDQCWYWQHIRPRITSMKQTVALLIQAVLGASLLVLFLAVGIGGIGMLLGAPVQWHRITSGLLPGVVFGLLASGGDRVGSAVAFTVGMGALWSVSNMFGLSGSQMLAKLSERPFVPGLIFSTSYALIWGGIIGLTLSVAEVVTKGVLWTSATSLRLAVLIGAIMLFGPFLLFSRLAVVPTYTTSLALLASVLICGALASGLLIGLIGGSRWATRQVVDDAERIRFAQPESSS